MAMLSTHSSELPDTADLNCIHKGILSVPDCFAGPPGWANGGFLSGLLAQALGARAATVTLHRPIPTGDPIELLRPDAQTLVLTHAGDIHARAQADEGPDEPTQAAVSAPAPASRWDRLTHDWTNHPFPDCFVCGPRRRPGQGMRILPVARSGAVLLAPWTPGQVPAGEALPAPLVWAALDCPGGFAALDGTPVRPILLGRMCTRMEAPVLAGEPHMVTAVRTGGVGRRHETRTAIFDRHGRRCAVSSCTWIEPRPA